MPFAIAKNTPSSWDRGLNIVITDKIKKRNRNDTMVILRFIDQILFHSEEIINLDKISKIWYK
ncbi:MAG: hypothetical protein NTW50_03480 [Candidatus Berkelbacteria bacterium]|nr:hypothetical protein [Candidatus Berkelbacteria bacterium]